jgi:hypothetical protein
MKTVKILAINVINCSDGSEMLSVKFSDLANPFAKPVTRNFKQQKNAAGDWAYQFDRDAIKVGMSLPGEIKSFATEPYDITSGDGTVRSANSYTTVILGHEAGKEASILKAAGKVLASSGASTSETVEEERPF